MNRENSNTPNILLAIIFLAGIGGFLYFIVKVIVQGLGQIQSQVSLGIIASATAATLSIVTLVITKHLERRAAILQELRAKKIPVYEELIGFFFTVFFATKRGEKPPTEQEMVKVLSELTPKILVWASDDVIKAYSNFRTLSLNSPTSKDLMGATEQLFLAIRRDLGHANKGLVPGSVLRLFLND